MKVLVITREIPPVGGGAGHVAIHLARELVAQGHQIVIVTMHYGNLPTVEQRDGIKIYRVRCGRRNQDSSYVPEMLSFLFRGSRLARNLVSKHGCDIVHAHSIVPDGRIALAAARDIGVPVVATAHGSDVPCYNPDKFHLVHRLVRPWWRRTLCSLEAVIAPSQHLAGLIQAAQPGQDVTIIPNGIRVDQFGSRPRDDSFLIVSRLVRRKNYHLFLKALRHVDLPVTVHIVGAGPMLDELRQLVGELRGHRVIFHGWLDNGSEAWRTLYETCRYFVQPSENENFPINLLEAQLAGLIVLASDIPGNREVLGDCAVYFKELQPESIAQTIRSVLSTSSADPGGWDALASAGQCRVRELFAWPEIARRYLSVFDSICSQRRSLLAMNR